MNMQGNLNQRHWQWRGYIALVFLRFCMSVFTTGMVHPDEYFQSQEVITRHFIPNNSYLQSELYIPWEYQLPHPNRSIIFPGAVVGLPYKILQLMGVALDGWIYLIAPRITVTFLSLIIDMIVYRYAVAFGSKEPVRMLLCFASSWPTMIFLTRPFSNTGETIILSISFAVLLFISPRRHIFFNIFHCQTLLLGCILAIGFFVRFTFLFYFFPIGLELVYQQDKLLQQQWHKKHDGQKTMPRYKRLSQLFITILQGFFMFLVVSLCLVAVDTYYFKQENIFSLVDNLDRIIIAPFNNMLYNLQYDNLKEHGIHSRLTHTVVNFPLLFGPLILLQLVRHRKNNARREKRSLHRTSNWFPIIMLLFPVMCLSIAPHQEPRFMLPTLIPLHLFFAKAYIKSSQTYQLLALLFNGSLVIFYGFLHQGGVLPLLLNLRNGINHPGILQSTLSIPSCNFNESNLHSILSVNKDVEIPLVFYKTYMPPRFILAPSTLRQVSRFHVVDLAGEDPHKVNLSLESLAVKSSSSHILMVIPASVSMSTLVQMEQETIWQHIDYLGSCSPHVTTEDFSIHAPFSLDLYHLEL